MKENFCDYETSKMLKELGYNEVCLAWFTDRADDKTQLQQMSFEMSAYYSEDEIKNSEVDEEVYCAPLWQQAKQWLWEKHKMAIYPEILSGYYYKIFKRGEIPIGGLTKYDSPIEAEIEGIKAAVKYLWENKQK